MATYISIVEDVTPETIAAIEAAEGAVYVVHAICATIPGRRKLARILKRKGCRPETVRELGWATAMPETESDSKACTPSPSPRSSSAPSVRSSSSRRKPKPTTQSDS